MSAASDYLEAAVLDHILGTTPLTAPTIWAALFTTDPTDAGSGTEVSGGSYARKLLPFDAASSPGGTADNSGAVEFVKATAPWGDVTHMALFDASSGGNIIVHGALSATVTITTDDIFRFPAASVTVTAA